jgi:plasmid stabilization system protein ParE
VDYQVFLTKRALSDLAQILGHIAEDSADTAMRFGNTLLDHVDLLARFARMGNVIRKRSRVRKLVHTPILVYYRIYEFERRVNILHLRHASRKLPSF